MKLCNFAKIKHFEDFLRLPKTIILLKIICIILRFHEFFINFGKSKIIFYSKKIIFLWFLFLMHTQKLNKTDVGSCGVLHSSLKKLISRASKVSVSNFLQFLTHFEIQLQQMDTQNEKKVYKFFAITKSC